MKEHTLQILDFFKFLEVLKEYTLSEVGRSYCHALRPLCDREKISLLYREVSAALDIIINHGDLPLIGFYDLRPVLQKSRAEGSVLSPEDFLIVRSALSAAQKVKEFLKTVETNYPYLQRWREKIVYSPHLYSALCSTFGPSGELLDAASSNLQRLRREIFILRSKIRKTLESLWDQENLKNVFQEQILTLRNERYVVAVKAEFKNSLPGIIHDQSHSGATYFIEPFCTVGENNELNLLLKEEKEEERRILKRLTDMVREDRENIGQTVEALGYLDLIFAKGKYAWAVKGIVPQLNGQKELALFQARHPLIPPNLVVPIDLKFEQGKNTLIISGANAGGKTVALKTIGLLTLMVQCGIPIPAAEGSVVAIFNHIIAEIGDEQSLQDNLSTFSAWIQAICRVLEEADESSLVLLDEVGGGTDPNEGAALTMALIDELRQRGAKTVITTHLHLLKAYGSAHPDVLNVSVKFDTETHRPTYQLIYGRPGESYALPIAQKLGLPSYLVERAKGYLSTGDRQIGQLLQNLEERTRAAEASRQEYETLSRELEKRNQQLKILIQQGQHEKRNLLINIQKEANHVIEGAREELRKIINEFKSKGRADIHRLEQVIKAQEEEIKALTEAKGEEILASFPQKEVWQWSLDASGAGPKKDIFKSVKKISFSYQPPTPQPELNIIGLRVEEALPILDKAIDEAFLGGLKELQVIHGTGTGRLRQAIREHLREHVFVKSFLPGAPGRGGDGVTIIEISQNPIAQSSRKKTGREKGKQIKNL